MSSSRQKTHSHGPGCRLAPLSYPPEINPELHGIPPLIAQFFYSSVIPIDDPLALAAAPDAKSSKPNPPRPFSQGDNNSLEKAWLSLASDEDRRDHRYALKSRSPSPSSARTDQKKIDAICKHLVQKHVEKHRKEGLVPSAAATQEDAPICCAELRIDASNELRRAFCALVRKRRKGLDEENVIQAVMIELEKALSAEESPTQPNRAKSASISSTAPITIGSIPSILNNEPGSAPSSLPATRIGRPERRTKGDSEADSRRSSISRANAVPLGMTKVSTSAPRPPIVDDGIAGKPFVRVATPEIPVGSSNPGLSSLLKGTDNASKPPSREGKALDPGQVSENPNQESANGLPVEDKNTWELRGQPVEVPVGVSRLHMVSLPVLQMKPIYWSPVNDISIVLRATWFYRDTMTPVEPQAANQLESGYRELQPWTEAWNDELRCAIDVGALGEEKVVQPLWPHPIQNKQNKPQEDDLPPPEPSISDDPHCAARCFHGEAAAEGTLEAIQKPDGNVPKSHANYYVLYKNSREAFLLKPSLKPSAYYGRRPVSKIVKGTDVGTPVVRGFDRDTWIRLHERPTSKSVAAEAQMLSQGSAPQTAAGVTCFACQADLDRWRVNDLVLVAHGIGQKFAERVESFHFTHAINAFRRAVNVELGNEQLRQAMGNGPGGKNGIMVLPVNWRHKLSFEDGGPMQDTDGATPVPDGFSLKDIEPKTIPAVRSMISDIMFDIPFYMSHHKPKMVHALVGEANRVYRLWCNNNPGFVEQGRVHLIAHSLGSVMALEVLSNQPTKTPPMNDLDLDNTRHFAFDTVNLFLLGSPAGFFLLLERGQLVPRRGRLKPGADPADVTASDVVSEQGQFGCLAVNNIYNILAREDPIAYLLNGTIDPVYAASLKTAYVPTTNVGMFQSIGNGIKGLWGGGTSTIHQQAGAAAAPVRPSASMRLPSQLELEVHDFTREEIAERKAYLLNDNGQIDYYLRSGGGPLEIQYLNMLSAHSSYWTSPDLVRMLCMEIGRKPGRSNTYPGMRAQKATKRMVPSSN
ncbi:hypothetical protein PspLS_00777 [Pyricularia sp. CBS 133598]|nr:hypothetical protein PspLS_00777 [Pyricularia sp. CBS 133598]